MEEVLAEAIVHNQDGRQTNQNDTEDRYEIYLIKHQIQQEMRRELDRYISILSHDIKTPVVAQIRTLEQVLTGNLKISKDKKDLLELILDSCYKQRDMINDLITTIKYKQNLISIEPKWFNIIDLLNELLKNQECKGKTIKLIMPNSEVMIKADREKLADAMYKILKNAIDKSILSEELQISLSERDKGHSLAIRLSWEEGCKISGINQYISNKSSYVSNNNYNPVGAEIETELANDIITSHGGRILSIRRGNQQTIEVELPILA